MNAAKHGGFIDHVYWERESDDFGMLKGIRNGVRVKKRARRSGSNGGAIMRCKAAVNAEMQVIREIKVSRSIESRSFLDNSPRSSLIPSLCAYDPESPPDESEISDYDESMPKLGKIFSSEECECEIGEARRESSKDETESKGESMPKLGKIFSSEECECEIGEARRESSKDETESKGDLCTLEQTQRGISILHSCRNVDEFERLNRIGEGTYGVVYRARNKKTGEIVALKQVKMVNEREGFPLTSLREIDILMSFHHPSIVELKEVVTGSNLDSIFIVMEYVEHDLKTLIEIMKQPFSQSEVKCLMLQLLQGVQCLHSDWVFHKDLKTSNLLLNNHGQLKICDFGLARKYGSSLGPYTQTVVTLWYRAPELLLGAKEYSTAVDMWSVGCIMAELLSKEPLFDGKTELDQLDKIFRILGTPNETIWPGLSKLPGGKVIFVKHRYNRLRRKFPAMSFSGPFLSEAGIDLLNKLLTYDPEKRIIAEKALDHDWFREVPLPMSKEFMLTFLVRHAQDSRTRRAMKSKPLEE